MKLKLFLLIVITFLGYGTSVAQNVITGNVASDDGAGGIPGVTVVIKGTNKGVTTDFDGNYSIEASSNDVLVFSSLGYKKQELTVGNESVINTKLVTDVSVLDEVIVVGYGLQKKVNLTGAVTQIKGEQLLDRPATSALDALQGTMAGAVVTRTSSEPGAEGIEIQIRGVSSVNKAPALILIDGIEGDIDDIRPENIESISILKDAAASAIYGAKAAGGVVLIISKKGTAGKMRVEFNTYVTMSKIGRAPERVGSSRKFAEMLNEARVNAGKTPLYDQASLDKFSDPNVQWVPHATKPNLWTGFGNANWVDIMIDQVTPLVSSNLAISGGNESTTYRASVNYYRNEGIIKVAPNYNEQLSARFNFNTKISDRIKLDNILSYSNTEIVKGAKNIGGKWGGLYGIYNSNGFIPSLYDPNGNLARGEFPPGRHKLHEYVAAVGSRTNEKNNVRLNSTLSINLAKGLNIRAIGAIDANFDNYVDILNRTSKYGVDGTRVGTLHSGDHLKKSQTNTVFKEFQFLMDYDVQLGNHGVSLLAGYSSQDYNLSSIIGKSDRLISPDLLSFNWAVEDGNTLTDNIQTYAFQSVFGRFKYNFKEKYLFEANFRYDGSSKLSPDDRYNLFPSISAAWRINEEDWFSSSIISEAKIRASWGQLGNSGVLSNYGHIATLKRENQLLLGSSANFYVLQDQLSSSITWETIETANIGIDLGFLSNRLTFTGEYYTKNNKDMIARVAAPSVIGIKVPNQNAGELKTWGWEATIGWRDKKEDFNYWFNFNIADSQNELIDYLGTDIVKLGNNKLLQGYPLNSMWGYKTEGHYFADQAEVDGHVFQNNKTGPGDTKYIDLNGDGKISTGGQNLDDLGDMVYLGNTGPRFTYGLMSGFKWKGLDFSLFLQGVGKRVFLEDQQALMPFRRGYTGGQARHVDSWRPDNTNAEYPRLYERGEHNFIPSDKWIRNGAYLRIKNIVLGYSLPETLTTKLRMQKLRFYVSGNDIFEFTKAPDHIDPESPGISFFQYPFRRRYTLGVNVIF